MDAERTAFVVQDVCAKVALMHVTLVHVIRIAVVLKVMTAVVMMTLLWIPMIIALMLYKQK